MQTIAEEYVVLFNAITDAEKVLQNLQARLVLAQQIAEDIYINSDIPAAPQGEIALVAAGSTR